MKPLLILFFSISSIFCCRAETPSDESTFLASLRKSIEEKDLLALQSLYDFSDVDQIYRDLEAFSWQDVTSEIADGKELKRVNLIPIGEADEYLKKLADGQVFQGRRHRPNLRPTRIVAVEVGTHEETNTSFFFVGTSKDGVLRLAGTTVVSDNGKAEAGAFQHATLTASNSDATDIALPNSVWRSEKFESEWGKAYFELTFLDAEKCEWKALSPEQKEPMFGYVGNYTNQQGMINFHMGDEIQGKGQIDQTGRSFVFVPTKGEDKVKFHKVLLRPKIKGTNQDGGAQPATRTGSDSQGDDKPQPESEGRSR